jgi:D-glycero-alpha-D-manno-heptose-7-phosphate kinase
MIITRTPLRITLGGGGTDLPSFYKNHGYGQLVAATIDKYTYISVNENFDDSVLLKYSEIERVEKLSDIKHPLLREALRLSNIHSRIEVSSMADVPSGTGLGSSGSFLVGLLNALALFQRRKLTPSELAASACQIEIETLREPIGKQDQYVAAFGGLQLFQFNSDESVNITPLKLNPSVHRSLEDNLLLFYTGIRRSASSILRNEVLKTRRASVSNDENLLKTRDFARATVASLESGDLTEFGRILTDQWKLKYQRQPSDLHDQIDELIQLGILNGALGGKLIGAGGGGFILFYAGNRSDLRRAMSQVGLEEIHFRFDYQGSSVLVAP